MLNDPNILSSEAFYSKSEKEAVHAWRDGSAGETLQRCMAAVAAQRYFEHDFANSDKPLLAPGQQ